MAKRVEVKNAGERADYAHTLKQIAKGNYCPFCDEKRFVEYHKKPTLYKGRYWFATHNNWPYEGTKHHFLLIHRTHVESVQEIPPKAWTDLQKALVFLQKKFKLKGASLFMRSGDPAVTGATVRHLHAQLIVGTRRNKTTEAIRVVLGFKKK